MPSSSWAFFAWNGFFELAAPLRNSSASFFAPAKSFFASATRARL